VPIALEKILVTAKVVSIPLKTKFRGVLVREALLFEGPMGWAEWSPFLEYQDAEAAVWLAAAIEFASDELPPLYRDRVAINATLPAVSPAEVAGVLAEFGAFGTVKIKVAEPGQSFGMDLDRILEVHKQFPDAMIRLDANGGWSVEQALMAVSALRDAKVSLEYLEQPCASVVELAQLRLTLKQLRLEALVAADESVRKAQDPLAVAQAGAADILVIKAAPLGGIGRAAQVVDQAGLPAVISSALETSVGISMGLHLAAALPDLPFACGLGTVALLASDVVSEPLVAIDGFLPVKRVTPDAAKLQELAANPERTQWWRERLERCYHLL
jgi:o-succinylbenzoate synthase